jgi:hypothetical protein
LAGFPFVAALCPHGSFVLQGQAAEFWLIPLGWKSSSVVLLAWLRWLSCWILAVGSQLDP